MPKSKIMLSQQMKSCDSFQIETVGDSPLSSSIALTNYNNQYNNISHDGTKLIHQSPTSLNSCLPVQSDSNSQLNSIHQSLPLLNRSWSVQSTMDRIGSYFGCFSQSTAFIANGFEEYGTTLLDKLWYTYLDIYSPRTTICYRISIFLN